ncbi:MAG: right-handed parallel beta-helix repeat-containing protein, partial [Nanoarchaeota archaeon]|nr:right-handed parallel beta-helix repeat-containing protein [Nanoarchaeota archaeon]
MNNSSVLRKSLHVLGVVLACLALASMFISLDTKITGFVVVDSTSLYEDEIRSEWEDSIGASEYRYTWFPSNPGELKSLKLNGAIEGSGSVRVTLVTEDSEYLVYKQGAVFAESIVLEETSNASLDLSIVALESDQILEFAPSLVDAPTGENLCSVWEVNGERVACYGSEGCCTFVGLQYSGEWDSSFFLSLGRYGSVKENNVVGQTILYDVDLSIPKSHIQYSNKVATRAIFETDSLEEVCVDTCSLDSLNASAYTLRIEVDNATLRIESIDYGITQQLTIPDTPPVLESDIANVTVYENYTATVDLSTYFKSASVLSYSVYDSEDISFIVEGDILTITPEPGFTGTRASFVTAIESYLTTVSNIFRIEVVSKPLTQDDVVVTEQVEMSPVRINAPVRWVKRVTAEKVVTNLTVNLSRDLINVTIIDTVTTLDLDATKVTLVEGSVRRNLSDYYIEKEVEKIELVESKLQDEKRSIIRQDPTATWEVRLINEELLVLQNEKNRITGAATVSSDEQGIFTQFVEWISGSAITGFVVADKDAPSSESSLVIEQAVDSVEIEYYTQGPVAVEQNISILRKQIHISSDIHYENILAFSFLETEIHQDNVVLYHVVNDSREQVSFDAYDLNNNSLIDYMEWVVPHLSNQTYEITLSVLNVQSYPPLGGNWTVRFNTTGIANLTIAAWNQTTYSEMYLDSPYSKNDLEPIELRCSDDVLWSKNKNSSQEHVRFVTENGTELLLEDTFNQSMVIVAIKVINYSCETTGYHTIVELTSGKHDQQITFGNITSYAKNDAGAGCIASGYTDGTGQACSQLGSCNGPPSVCSTWDSDEPSCTGSGCDWNAGPLTCTGTPNACETTYTDMASCMYGCMWSTGTNDTCIDTDADQTMESTDGCHLSAGCVDHVGSSCSYYSGGESVGICTDGTTGFQCTTTGTASGEYGTGISGGSAANFHSGNENASCNAADTMEICNSAGASLDPTGEGVCDSTNVCQTMGLVTFDCIDTTCSVTDITTSSGSTSCTDTYACDSGVTGAGWVQDGICATSCVTSGHICYSDPSYYDGGCGGDPAFCSEGDPCDATLTDGNFDSTYGTCGSGACVAASSGVLVDLPDVGTLGYFANGSTDSSIVEGTTYSNNQEINFTHATWGLRVSIHANFTTGVVNLTNMSINQDERTTVLNITTVTNVLRNHTLFVPSREGTGVFVCPHADTLENVTPNCPDLVGFSNDELNTGSTIKRGGVIVTLLDYLNQNERYMITNLSGSGAQENVAGCGGTLGTFNQNYTLVKNIASTFYYTCLTINASNVTLDCAGFNITYANGGAGAGINISKANNVKIHNCDVRQNTVGTTQSSSPGILLQFSNNTIIENTTVFTNGSTSVGIYMDDKSNYNILTNLSIQVKGSNGVEMHGTNNVLNYSMINVAFNAGGYGVYLNNENNSIDHNTINGTDSSYGVWVFSSRNNITANRIVVEEGPSSGIQIEAGNNIIRGNNISVKSISTTSSYGIYINGVDFNKIYNNTFDNVSGSAIHFYGQNPYPEYNNISNNTYRDVRGYDLEVPASSSIYYNWFIDYGFSNYSISSSSSKLIFKRSGVGIIDFTENLVGDAGVNLSQDVLIKHNFAGVNSEARTFMNASTGPSNITLYTIGAQGVINHTILRDGAVCNTSTVVVCTNYTRLNDDTVVFSVEHFSNYTINGTPPTEAHAGCIASGYTDGTGEACSQLGSCNGPPSVCSTWDSDE